METRGSIANWRMTLAEGIILASGAIGIMLWSMSTFQKKDDADETKKALQERIHVVELEISSLRRDVSEVAKDTQYIRGRIQDAKFNR